MKAVIMAGGKGTRIAPLHPEIPKPMIPLSGKPVLAYELECLKSQGYQDVIIVVGHLKDSIMTYFGNGNKWGMRIRYIEEDSPLGTAGALYYLKEETEEDILLLNGDIIFDIDIRRLYNRHRQHGGLATLLTHPNDHPYDSGIIVTDSNDRVTDWLHKEDPRLWYRNQVNAGIHILSPGIFRQQNNLFREPKKLDLDRDILKPLISSKELYAYSSPEYVKDMGTPERLAMVEADLKTGRVQARNLQKAQKAIFLDRDGTINQNMGFVRRPEEFVLLPHAADAIRAINQSDYLAIVVTNQPVIARGEASVEQLQEIHNKMETLLGNEGAYVDAIYYCPHHPDKGYAGEVKSLKIDCDCRKPKPGMLLQAARNYNIDLSQSWMVGDSERDILAGNAAGCRTAYLGSPEQAYGQSVTFASLKEFTDSIMKG